jgi:hypothetical protein
MPFPKVEKLPIAICTNVMPLLHRPVTPGVAIRIPSGCGLTAVLPA